MIRIENLQKSFGKRTILRDITLTINPGKVTALIGPNGAGKSTLIKSMLGLVKPEKGNIFIDDTPVSNEKVRCMLGYMPQTPQFPPHMTVREIMEFVQKIEERRPTSRHETAESIRLTVRIR